MPFQKGHPKLGGKKKGTLNKKTRLRLKEKELQLPQELRLALAAARTTPLEMMHSVMLIRASKGLLAAEKAAPYCCRSRSRRCPMSASGN